MTDSFLHGVEVIELEDDIGPIKINKSGVIGIVGTAPDADNDDWPLDEPILLTSQPRKAATLGVTGTLGPSLQQIYAEGGATVVVVRVATAVDPAQQLTKVIGTNSAKTGCYALLGARAQLGVPPRTLIAPGFTSTRPVTSNVAAPNPVVGALIPIAQKLRGRIYMDTPSTSHNDALAARQDWASDRVVPFYPSVLVWDPVSSAYVTRPASASMAGLTAQVHDRLGFWYSPSNQVLAGVGGTSAVIDYAAGDPNSEANILNENRIATLINMGGDYSGWRRWGNRNCADNALWVFESVRTALDMVYEAIAEAEIYAVDKPPSLQLLRDMQARVQAFFDYGKREGFLVGGKVWLDPERNTPDQAQQGIWSWDIDPEAPAPMEHIKIYARRNGDYYADEVAQLVNLVAASN